MMVFKILSPNYSSSMVKKPFFCVKSAIFSRIGSFNRINDSLLSVHKKLQVYYYHINIIRKSSLAFKMVSLQI